MLSKSQFQLARQLSSARAMSTISSVHARQILDSRGNPTVEVDLKDDQNRLFRASVPSGASTGIHEATELRDGNKSVYLGKSVMKAVHNVNTTINDKIKGFNVEDQQGLDDLLINLDGTENKSNLGANAILGVSLAAAKAGAGSKNVPLYQHIADLSGKSHDFVLPVPSFNVINGGSHAGNGLSFQEFMVMPTGADSFSEAMQMGCEIYHHLKTIIKKKYGQDATNVGDEGGFAPNVANNQEALDLVMSAIQKAGYEKQAEIAMDIASSEFYTSDHMYDLNFKTGEPGGKITPEELLNQYVDLINNYPIISIEDPFDQDDWGTYQKFTAKVGDKIQIVGDDLLCTNPKRIARAIDEKSCNALLLKVNQIGSVSESIKAVNQSQSEGWGVMTSHRSGETEDSYIADIAVGLRTGQIKTGAPCRSERLAKYNQLLRIEEELGEKATYAGKHFRSLNQ